MNIEELLSLRQQCLISSRSIFERIMDVDYDMMIEDIQKDDVIKNRFEILDL